MSGAIETIFPRDILAAETLLPTIVCISTQWVQFDALYALMNPPASGGFPSNCQRISTYVKLFGDAQNFEKLINTS